MEPCIILGQQIMDLIRSSGMTKLQAHSALSIAGTLLLAAEDITFQDLGQGPELVSLPDV